MVRIAICDDEIYFRERIGEILTDYMDKRTILYKIDKFESGKDLIRLDSSLGNYDIVFLDMNMDEVDGMKAAQKIREISNDVFIVFVTAFITYALDGYSVGAVRYILKNHANFADLIYECMDAIGKKMNHGIRQKEFVFQEGIKKYR